MTTTTSCRSLHCCIVKVRQMKNFNNIFRLRLHGNTSSLFKGIFAALVLICFNSQLITSMGVLVLVLVLGGLGELRVQDEEFSWPEQVSDNSSKDRMPVPGPADPISLTLQQTPTPRFIIIIVDRISNKCLGASRIFQNYLGLLLCM